jgi:predicted protein tyrosine phosphatase
MQLIVCGLADVEPLLAARRPSHMITLLDPATLIAMPTVLAPERHLRLGPAAGGAGWQCAASR